MYNKNLQELLKQYPDNMEVFLCHGIDDDTMSHKISPFESENITDAGKGDIYDEELDLFTKKDDERYIVINPPIR